MREKIEGIQTIQETLWRIYKEFLTEKDKKSYRKQALKLEYGYEGDLKWFCRNLNSVWEPVIDLMEQCLENGDSIEQMHVCIMDIQNSVWSVYRAFMKNHQMPEYTEKSAAIVKKYKNDKDMMLFAQTLILSWVPVINGLAEEFRDENGGKQGL